jgi:hypothetical protein
MICWSALPDYFCFKTKTMKKIFLPILFAALISISYSCSGSRFGSYTLNERDAADAIRELLQIGAKNGLSSGAFSKETMMSAIFPEGVRKALNTMQQLGITNEVDRFTTTLGTAAEKTAERSIPIFLNGISNMKFNDAVRIIKTGGTSATDYLRSSVGSELRLAITPVVQNALDEYKLNDQWKKITQPLSSVTGNKVNLDLATLMAGVVSEKMFQKIEEKEKEIRTNANARTTTLLQKVFSRSWN